MPIDYGTLIAAAVPTFAAVVGYGKLQQQAKQNSEEISKRATNDRVDGLRDTIELTHESVQKLADKFDRFLERERR